MILFSTSKIRGPISRFPIFSLILRQRLDFLLHFRLFSSDKLVEEGIPNLHNHKDWLSQPEVVRIFQGIKDPDFILPLFTQLSRRKDYNPNESVYSVVINKLAGANKFDGVGILMQKIKLERKCRLSDAFFRNVIKIYGNSAGRVDKAVETLFDMPSYKCWPSVVTFNCVLNMLISAKQFQLVHEVYAGATNLGVDIDSCCLNIIIKGLCECGQMEAAFKVLDEFPHQNCSPNVRTFSTIMHGLCDLGRVDEAFSLLDRMESEGVDLDAIVFNILILGLRKQGRVDEAIELFERIATKGCQPNPGTYQEVLYCLIDTKNFLEAKKFMERMIEKRVNPSFESYKLAIRGLCRENLVSDVEWLLKQMVLHGFTPRMGMWRRMVSSAINNGLSVSLDYVIET